jgi:hypothetical protein
MDLEALVQWRRQRLAELAEKVGGKAELGRRLGYKDGGFVGHMISGHRPITEKTILTAETIRHENLGPGGARGWFDPRQQDEPSLLREPEPVYAALSDEQNQLLADLGDIPPARRAKLIDMIAQEAASAREAAEYHRRKEQAAASPRREKTAAARSQSRSVATVAAGTPESRQRSLPLSTVENPFEASPDAREAAWYKQLPLRPDRS